MASRQTRVIGGNLTATQSFTLDPGLLQYVQSVFVEVDNTAGGDIQPTLSIKTNNGQALAKKQQGRAISAGVIGSATWALRLDDEQTPATVPTTIGAMLIRDGAAAVQNVPSGFLSTRTAQLQHNTVIWQAGCNAFTTAGNSRIVVVTAGVYLVAAATAWVLGGAAAFAIYADFGVTGGIDTGAVDTRPRAPGQPNFVVVSDFVRLNAGAVISQGVGQSSGVGVNAPTGYLRAVRLGPLP